MCDGVEMEVDGSGMGRGREGAWIAGNGRRPARLGVVLVVEEFETHAERRDEVDD